jgi:putative transposase
MGGEKFKNTYRIESARLPGHNYGQPGWFFITINTKDRVCWFGEVIDEEMIYSDAGRMVADEWVRTADMRPNVRLDEWVVMPNHVHMLFAIVDVEHVLNIDDHTVETHCNASLRYGHASCNGSTIQSHVRHPYKNEFGPQRNNVASIIRGFKDACTKRINMETPMPHFAWHSRFYDRIVRDERTFHTIRQYIRDNPKKWWHDRNNPIGK